MALGVSDAGEVSNNVVSVGSSVAEQAALAELVAIRIVVTAVSIFWCYRR